jgi:hypothetical protein
MMNVPGNSEYTINWLIFRLFMTFYYLIGYRKKYEISQKFVGLFK